MKIFIIIIFTFFSFCKPYNKEMKKEDNENTSKVVYDSNEILFINAKGGLRLRSEPSTKSKIVYLIPQGSFVSVLEQTNAIENIDGINGVWVKIRFNNYIGYSIDNYFCKIMEESDNPNNLKNNCKNEIETINKEFKNICNEECISLKKYTEGDAGSGWEMPATLQIKDQYFGLHLKYEHLDSGIFYAKKINDTYYIIFSTSENLDFDSKYGTGTTKIKFIESQNKVLAEDIYSLKKYNKNSNNLLIEYVKKQ